MRLWVSDLCTWQRYCANENITLEQCLADLRRESPMSPAAEAGTNLHSALEHAEYETETTCLQWRGYKFFFNADINLEIPVVRELKAEFPIDTPTGKVILVGKVDTIGSSIGDYKLTGNFDAERLLDSYQWRCYLHMFNADKFVYQVFVGEEIKPTEWAIKEYHEVQCFRYPGMEADVTYAVEAFASFYQKYVKQVA